MKQEPIAWTDDLWSIFLNDEYCMLDDDMKKDMIPLYTAPKELSDEEIQILKDLYTDDIYGNGLDVIGFARALLKKASEK